jgi:hypothetical protein
VAYCTFVFLHDCGPPAQQLLHRLGRPPPHLERARP